MADVHKQDEVVGVGGRDFDHGSLGAKLVRTLSNPKRLVTRFLRKQGYRQGWDHLGSDRTAAYNMVDSSQSEAELTRRGAEVAKRLGDALLLDGTQAVLEIGCGPARIGRELASRCRHWHGADISGEMLRLARERTRALRNVSFLQLEGARLDGFADGSLERIYCHSVLVHIDKEDMFKYLTEIARVLRPGGLAYVDTWSLLHEQSWRWFSDSAKSAPLTGRKEAWRPQFATRDEVRHFIGKAGLTEVVLLDRSHLLQAFVTVDAPDRAVATADALRERILPFLEAVVGLD